MKKGDAYYSVKITKDEFKMLNAFKRCTEDSGEGTADERELQEYYSMQFRKEFPFLDQIHIKEIRDILEGLEKAGIMRRISLTKPEEDVWGLVAAERGCTFEMVVGDED